MASLLVDDELARAIRHESAQALCYWWGVSNPVVTRWRRSLGVARMDSEGSRRLILAACERGAAQVRGQAVPPLVREMRRRIATEGDFAGRMRMCRLLAEEVALLGTDSDQAIAAQLGRTPDAVRLLRIRLGIVAFGAPPALGPGLSGNRKP
jgi:hypothetical protein